MNAELTACHDSFAYHGKSFSLAARLFDAQKRDAAAVVYAWCRRADDAIDTASPGGTEAPSEALLRLRRELDSVYAGEPQSDAILQQFQRVVFAFGVPQRYAHELLDGMQLDVEGARYEQFTDLRRYCYCVASTVGIMMCHIMGVRSPVALQHAEDLGVAMQLTNIARDVLEDWQRGRCYLPEALLREAGHRGVLEPGTPIVVGSPLERALADVTLQMVTRSESYYASGDAGLPFLGWRDALAVSAARQVYSEIGRVVAKRGGAPLSPRAVVSLPRKLYLLAKGALAALRSRWTARTSVAPAAQLEGPGQ